MAIPAAVREFGATAFIHSFMPARRMSPARAFSSTPVPVDRTSFEFEQRETLSFLAEALLVDEVIVMPGSYSGITQLLGAFGPELATRVVASGRVLLPQNLRGIRSEKDLHDCLSDMVYPFNSYWSKRTKHTDRFLATILEKAVVPIDEPQFAAIRRRADVLCTSWLDHIGRDDVIVHLMEHRLLPVFLDKDTDVSDAALEVADSIAFDVSMAWSFGAMRASLGWREQDLLMLAAMHPKESRPTLALKSMLTYERLPDLRRLVVRGHWGAREVVECVTSRDAVKLRKWFRANLHRGGDALDVVLESHARLPRTILWRKALRFASTTALTNGLAALLGADSSLATALGVSIGAIDQFFGDDMFAPWHPRVWVEQYRDATAEIDDRSPVSP